MPSAVIPTIGGVCIQIVNLAHSVLSIGLILFDFTITFHHFFEEAVKPKAEICECIKFQAEIKL